MILCQVNVKSETVTAMQDKNLTLSKIAKQFSDEESAWLFLEEMLWLHGPICPHCGVVNYAYYLEPKNGKRVTSTGKASYRRLWECGDCHQQFSVLVGTVMERSHIPISKWLLAIHMMNAGKNGVAALELSRVLGIGYRAAWFMCHRIRFAMAPQEAQQEQLSGIVEADETYIGGRAHGKRGRGAANKTPVVTLIERDGEARSQVVTNVTGENIKAILTKHVEPEATLMTDSYPVYDKPGQEFAAHHTVDHGAKEYARTDVRADGTAIRAHINTAEGFFSQLKRSIDGTYHHASEHHLHRYLAEFDFRYSTHKVKDGERTVRAIRQTAGKRLRYQAPLQQDLSASF
jgi:transposase-like protein